MNQFKRWAKSVGLFAPASGPDPYRARRGEPRGFALAWTGFLILATASCFATYGATLGISPRGYINAARALTGVLGAGIAILWPVVRLSQAPAQTGGSGVVARDLVIILLPLQAVLWPQALVARWPIETIGAVAITLTAWAAAVGAVVAMALGPGVPRAERSGAPCEEAPGERSRPTRALPRTGAMLLIIVVVSWGLAAIAIDPTGAAAEPSTVFWAQAISPITAPMQLTRVDGLAVDAIVPRPSEAQWRAIAATGILAASGWVLAMLTESLAPSRSAPR